MADSELRTVARVLAWRLLAVLMLASSGGAQFAVGHLFGAGLLWAAALVMAMAVLYGAAGCVLDGRLDEARRARDAVRAARKAIEEEAAG